MLADRVRRLTINTSARSFEIETVDGRIHQEVNAFPREPEGTGLPPDFRLLSYDTADRTLTLTPPDGEPLIVEVFDGSNQSERRAGRPTIYLDQNKWVLLGQTVHTPDRVPPSELAAGQELVRLAETQRVILLLSSGHLIETARVTGSRRRIAPLMVRLSRGWLMSDPLLVRQAELTQLFQARASVPVGPAIDVLTLDLAQLYVDPISSGRLRALPEEIQQLTTRGRTRRSTWARR